MQEKNEQLTQVLEQNGFKLSCKLCLNLCSLRSLSPSLSLVRNLIPNGPMDFKYRILNRSATF